MIQITPHMKILVAEGKTMEQAIYFSESKLRGKLPVTGYLCLTSPPTHSVRRCRA
jgi:hypothetical protein